MLGYQSLSFHDVLTTRRTLGLRPAAEFEAWLRRVGMVDDSGQLTPFDLARSVLRSADFGDEDPSSERPTEIAVQEFWDELRKTTQARIGLGRAGNALPTRRVLELAAAHAAARDAVHMPLDTDHLGDGGPRRGHR